jgi:hypothetical protein
MTRISSRVILIVIAVMLAVFAGRAISAQDKYTLQIPGGHSQTRTDGALPGLPMMPRPTR